jgi:hypothetical protein
VGFGHCDGWWLVVGGWWLEMVGYQRESDASRLPRVMFEDENGELRRCGR